MMKHWIRAAGRPLVMACASIAVLAGGAHAQCEPIELIVNGDFESPVIADNSISTVVPTPWAWTSAQSGFLFRGQPAAIWPTAFSGSQYVDIGNAVGQYRLSQNFVVSRPALVRISWAASAAATAGESLYQVLVSREGGSVVAGSPILDGAGPYPPVPGRWKQETLETLLVPTDAGTVFRVDFQPVGNATSFDTLIDDVRVELLRRVQHLFPGLVANVPSPEFIVTFAAQAVGHEPLTWRWERETTPGVWQTVVDGIDPVLGTVTGSTTRDMVISEPAAGITVRVRGVATNPCGSVPQDPPWTMNVGQCNSIDFNRDGLFPDDLDLVDYLNVLAGGPCSTPMCSDLDFNNDGLFPDDNDLIAFLRVLAGGECNG
jgi:hypothetical protein